MDSAAPAKRAKDDALKSKHSRLPLILAAIVLVVALTVVLFSLIPTIVHWLHPFPSEHTALSANGGGVIWEHGQGYVSVQGLTYSFSNMRISVAYPPQGTTFSESETWTSGTFNVSRVIIENFSTFGYPEANSTRVSGEETAQGIVWNTFWFVIDDSDSDGIWGQGDSLAVFSGLTLNGTVVKQGFLEDTEYAVGVMFVPPLGTNGGSMALEYHFAFDHGKFYSWLPDRIVLR